MAARAPARSLATAGVLILLALAGTAPAKADCTALDAEVRAALQAKAVARFDALAAKVRAEPSCDAAYRSQTGRLMARVVLAGLPSTADGAAIEAVFRYGRPWQALAAAADARFEKQDWAKAVALYEEALDDIRDVSANPNPPPAEIEKRIYKRAVEARALAPTFVATRAFRGKKSGLASPHFRTFSAVSVPVPVQFDTGAWTLTGEGTAAIKDIFAYVSQNPGSVLRIVGHTDPRGGNSYNLDLSRKRAETVAAYLAELGYKGKVEVTGKGRSEPFQPDDAAKYTEEQRWAFDRRVEYQVLP